MVEPIIVSKIIELIEPHAVFITKDVDPYQMKKSLRDCSEIYVSHENHYLTTGLHVSKMLPIVRVYYPANLSLRVILRYLTKLTEEEKQEYQSVGYLVIHDRRASVSERINLVMEANAEEHVRQTIVMLAENRVIVPGHTVPLIWHIQSEQDANRIIDKYARYLDRSKLYFEECRIMYRV